MGYWVPLSVESHELLHIAQSAGCTLKQAPTLLLIRSTTQNAETTLSGSRSLFVKLWYQGEDPSEP
jgi:hypothetical protein